MARAEPRVDEDLWTMFLRLERNPIERTSSQRVSSKTCGGSERGGRSNRLRPPSLVQAQACLLPIQKWRFGFNSHWRSSLSGFLCSLRLASGMSYLTVLCSSSSKILAVSFHNTNSVAIIKHLLSSPISIEMPLPDEPLFGNRHTHMQLRCFLKIAGKAMYRTIMCLTAWMVLSEQLIVRLPLTERRILNPIAGLNWLQFVGRYDPIDFVAMTNFQGNEMPPWDRPLPPWKKTMIVVLLYSFATNAYALGTMTREQDARCIILSVLLTMKLFAVLTRQLPLLDIMLVVTVFWVMAGCPVACSEKIKEVVATFGESLKELVKEEFDTEIGPEVAELQHHVKEMDQKTAEYAKKFDKAKLAFEKRLAELEATNPQLAEALKSEINLLMDIFQEGSDSGDAKSSEDQETEVTQLIEAVDEED